MAETVVEIEELRKMIGPREVLRGVTLSLRRGEILALIGPNGAGKTTTIRMLLGLLRPSRGLVHVFGLDPWSEGQAVRSRCGVVFESDMLYETMTAYDNLFYWARLYRLQPIEARRRADELLERSGLGERRNEKVQGLSKGMKRRIALMRSILHRPSLLLLDEPMAGLDVESRIDFRALIQDLARENNASVVIASHELYELERLCSRAAIIKEGKIELDESMDLLTHDLSLENVYLNHIRRVSQDKPSVL